MTEVPRLLLLTDRHVAAAAGRALLDTVAAAVDAGVPAVVGRDKDLPRAARARLLGPVAARVRAGGARFLVASDPALAAELGADGVHLAAADPPAPTATGLVGRSCHDRAEVVRARAEGATYATVSPYALTPTKPGYGPPLGPGGLADLVATAEGLPLLALGGIDARTAASAVAAGAYGVAVLAGILGAPDPAAATRALCAALVDDPSRSEPTP